MAFSSGEDVGHLRRWKNDIFVHLQFFTRKRENNHETVEKKKQEEEGEGTSVKGGPALVLRSGGSGSGSRSGIAVARCQRGKWVAAAAAAVVAARGRRNSSRRRRSEPCSCCCSWRRGQAEQTSCARRRRRGLLSCQEAARSCLPRRCSSFSRCPSRSSSSAPHHRNLDRLSLLEGQVPSGRAVESGDDGAARVVGVAAPRRRRSRSRRNTSRGGRGISSRCRHALPLGLLYLPRPPHVLVVVAQGDVEIERLGPLGEAQTDEGVPPRGGVGEAEHKVARGVCDGLDDLGTGAGSDGGDGEEVAAVVGGDAGVVGGDVFGGDCGGREGEEVREEENKGAPRVSPSSSLSLSPPSFSFSLSPVRVLEPDLRVVSPRQQPQPPREAARVNAPLCAQDPAIGRLRRRDRENLHVVAADVERLLEGGGAAAVGVDVVSHVENDREGAGKEEEGEKARASKRPRKKER